MLKHIIKKILAMKKNITIISIFLFITLSVFSQKIETIDYGTDYYNLKEVGYLDFKMKCSSGWRINGTLVPYMLENDAPYSSKGYANSKFQSFLKSKDSQLEKMYKKDLVKLGDEFHKYHNHLYSGFKSGSKKAFKYMKLHLDKFEIISEYYKDLYNYKLDKAEEEKLIAAKMDSISKITSASINQTQSDINNDEELNNLKKSKIESINSISTEYNVRIKQLETEKKEKIAKLELSNYTERKNEIVKEYDPKIVKLKTEKQSKIKDAETFWDDKINNRENEISIIIENKTSQIENSQIKAQNTERKETKSVNQLEKEIEQIEINYEKAINDIDTKIKGLFGK
jgi:hypothetical protein